MQIFCPAPLIRPSKITKIIIVYPNLTVCRIQQLRSYCDIRTTRFVNDFKNFLELLYVFTPSL